MRGYPPEPVALVKLKKDDDGPVRPESCLLLMIIGFLVCRGIRFLKLNQTIGGTVGLMIVMKVRQVMSQLMMLTTSMIFLHRCAL